MFSCWSILQQDPKSNPPTAGNLTEQTIKINYPFQDDFPIFHMTICNIFPITIQWPSQEPKLEVPTIYKAYFSGLCKGISPQNMAWNMVLTYLHFRILEFPLNNVDPTLRPAAGFSWNNRQLRSSLFLGTNKKPPMMIWSMGFRVKNVKTWLFEVQFGHGQSPVFQEHQ